MGFELLMSWTRILLGYSDFPILFSLCNMDYTCYETNEVFSQSDLFLLNTYYISLTDHSNVSETNPFALLFEFVVITWIHSSLKQLRPMCLFSLL